MVEEIDVTSENRLWRDWGCCVGTVLDANASFLTLRNQDDQSWPFPDAKEFVTKH